MNKIHLLDEEITNRIAAGEVVERPASIVKELIENSVDAQATAVSVDVENGGIRKISVSDNGQGIEKDDLSLAVLKHATSKIFSLEDLNHIFSMGFRGEAMASIAAVSIMQIVSRTKNAETGARILVRGGQIVKKQEVGAPEGTTVTVENLFYNTPARLKFLKSPGAEAAQISDIVGRLILAYPGVSIKYSHNGEVLFHSPGSEDLADAIMTVYGVQMRDQIVPVDASYDDIRVSGYIGKPVFALKSQKYQSVFLNDRYVKSQLIRGAVEQGYGQRLLKGAHPFYCLHIELPFSDVDVNVHPNKLSVHFKDEQKLEYIVINAVMDALAKRSDTPVLGIEQKTPVVSERQPYIDQNIKKPENPEPEDLSDRIARVMECAQELEPNVAELKQYTFDISREDKDEERVESITPFNELTESYRIIGTAWNAYIIVECGDTLYFIDQHAAHERLMFEKLKADIQTGAVVSQMLLVPEVLQVTHEDKLLLEKNRDVIRTLGIELEPFGPLSVKISAIPQVLGELNVKKLMDALTEELQKWKGGKDIILRAELVMRRACRLAVKAGNALSDAEIKVLIADVVNADTIPNCPHGRPVAIALTKQDLEKGFKRRV